MSELEELLTDDDVSRILRVSKGWVKDHASGRRRPSLPCIRLGGKGSPRRYRAADIAKFLEQFRHLAAEENGS
jgi:hypothetical protein